MPWSTGMADPTTYHICFNVKDRQRKVQGGVFKDKAQVWKVKIQGQGGQGVQDKVPELEWERFISRDIV